MNVLEYLLSKGADLNARTKWGDTAGHYAALSAKYEALRYLLEKGIDVNKDKMCK